MVCCPRLLEKDRYKSSSLQELMLSTSSGGQNDNFRPLTYTFGGGAWVAGTNMWHTETPASYESLPAPLATQIPTLWIHTSGGRGRGGALILDRCCSFDLFASVDAHLWVPATTCKPAYMGALLLYRPALVVPAKRRHSTQILALKYRCPIEITDFLMIHTSATTLHIKKL